MNNIEKTLKYYELLMTKDLSSIIIYELPDGYSFKFWDNDNCIKDWIKIHLDTGEFNNLNEAQQIFHEFYKKIYGELNKRCFFIENNLGEKIATATISPTYEFGYKCALDWFAISPKAQGLNLSKPLLSKALFVAKNLGYDKILLHTQTHTWLAAKIYLDYGFEPLNTEDNKGWEILKTITNHPKLNKYNSLQSDELYDNLIIKIKKQLDKLHKNYNYSVWYIDNKNDVYVCEDQQFFSYKFIIDGNNVNLIKQ